MKSTQQGQLAERKVAKYLKGHGYTILDLNWRHRLCEIDLVAKKRDVIYLVEVKYRASDSQGDGFSYITSKKLDQIILASKIWVSVNDWDGDIRLLAASVSGANCEALEILELD